MTLTRTLQISVATAICAAAAAQAALAGGEPKNTPPFTRPAVDGRSPAAAINLTASTIASARASIRGESKNEQPFTLRNDADTLTRFLRQNSHSTTRARLGEPKNEAPFTLHAGPRA